jgi:antirestriction protein ArdC
MRGKEPVMPKAPSRPSCAPSKHDPPKEPKPTSVDWAHILIDAVNKSGVMSSAYSAFWNYSTGNQLLAMLECMARGLEVGPIHTFRGWLNLNRHVRKGEKAITLCMPVTVKRKRDKQSLELSPVRVGDGAERQLTGPGGKAIESEDTSLATVFVYKPHWFVLSQTDGEEYVPTVLPTWTEAQALHNLMIDRVRFTHSNGNCQGYAMNRTVSVSPVAALAHKTLFHELAHIVLGHTAEGQTLDDHELTPRNLREVEAESVAMICCASLNLSGEPESRGYIQSWMGKEKIPERSAQRIFKAADTILKAGYPQVSKNPAETPA